MEFQSIFLGKAIFTLKSLLSGDHLTYKIIRKSGRLWYLYVMTGCDNQSHYTYLGYINHPAISYFSHDVGEKFLYWSERSNLPSNSKEMVAFKYWFSRQGKSDLIEFNHSGRCLKCGKLLTTPESIKTGIGPKCSSRL